MPQLEWQNCRTCTKRLFRAYLEGDSVVEIKCETCHNLNTISIRAKDMVPDDQGGYATKVALEKF